jgi:hypothetical protein
VLHRIRAKVAESFDPAVFENLLKPPAGLHKVVTRNTA